MSSYRRNLGSILIKRKENNTTDNNVKTPDTTHLQKGEGEKKGVREREGERLCMCVYRIKERKLGKD